MGSKLWLFCYNYIFSSYLSLGGMLERLVLKKAVDCTSQRLKWTSGARVVNLVFNALDLTLTNVWRTWAIFDRRLSDLSYLWPTSVGLELPLPVTLAPQHNTLTAEDPKQLSEIERDLWGSTLLEHQTVLRSPVPSASVLKTIWYCIFPCFSW